jgi:hypothetical protein
LYTPAVETVIDCVVSPVDQRLSVGDEDVNVTNSPSQNVVGLEEVTTGAVGAGSTFTVTG